MSLTGQKEGTAGAEPMKVRVALTDVLTGLCADIGILAALRHRDTTGLGQQIDMALLDVQVATPVNQAMKFPATGSSPKPLGNAHSSTVPYQAFEASDGYGAHAIGNDGQFTRFCDVAGLQGLAKDDRFAPNPERLRNRAMLAPILQDVMSGPHCSDQPNHFSPSRYGVNNCP